MSSIQLLTSYIHTNKVFWKSKEKKTTCFVVALRQQILKHAQNLVGLLQSENEACMCLHSFVVSITQRIISLQKINSSRNMFTKSLIPNELPVKRCHMLVLVVLVLEKKEAQLARYVGKCASKHDFFISLSKLLPLFSLCHAFCANINVSFFVQKCFLDQRGYIIVEKNNHENVFLLVMSSH